MSRPFDHPDARGEGGHNEEEDRLLEAIVENIDSDDEQAKPLSPDQIKRYLDESETKEEEQHHSDASHRTGRRRPGEESPHRPRASPVHTRQGRSFAPILHEHDELFDEEFDDEPENVVVGATHHGRRPRDSGSLNKWIDTAEEGEEDMLPPPALIPACEGRNMFPHFVRRSSNSNGRLTPRPSMSFADAWADALDEAWPGPDLLAWDDDAPPSGGPSLEPLRRDGVRNGMDFGPSLGGAATTGVSDVGAQVTISHPIAGAGDDPFGGCPVSVSEDYFRDHLCDIVSGDAAGPCNASLTTADLGPVDPFGGCPVSVADDYFGDHLGDIASGDAAGPCNAISATAGLGPVAGSVIASTGRTLEVFDIGDSDDDIDDNPNF